MQAAQRSCGAKRRNPKWRELQQRRGDNNMRVSQSVRSPCTRRCASKRVCYNTEIKGAMRGRLTPMPALHRPPGGSSQQCGQGCQQ
eukprot:3156614-Pyramimonas_sp.AAC.1